MSFLAVGSEWSISLSWNKRVENFTVKQMQIKDFTHNLFYFSNITNVPVSKTRIFRKSVYTKMKGIVIPKVNLIVLNIKK